MNGSDKHIDEILSLLAPMSDGREENLLKVPTVLEEACRSGRTMGDVFHTLYRVIFGKMNTGGFDEIFWWMAVQDLSKHDPKWWPNLLATRSQFPLNRDADAMLLDALGRHFSWPCPASESAEGVALLLGLADDWVSIDAPPEPELWMVILRALNERRSRLTPEQHSIASRWLVDGLRGDRIRFDGDGVVRAAADGLFASEQRIDFLETWGETLRVTSFLSSDLASEPAELFEIALATHWETAARLVERTWSQSGAKEPIHPRVFGKLLKSAPNELSTRLRGFFAMTVALTDDWRRAEYRSVIADDALLRMADLIVVASNGHGMVPDGARAELERLAADQPDTWAALVLPALRREDHARVVVPLTANLAGEHVCVANAIQLACDRAGGESRLRAAHLRALAEGAPGAGASVNAALASRVASDLDRHRVFPSPLVAPSATWVCDADLESELRTRVGQAGRMFLQRHADQFGLEEERLLAEYLRDLGEALRGRPAAWLEGAVRTAARPDVIVQTRVHTKTEEATTNMDVAFIVVVAIDGAIDLQLAEAVQVKKATRAGSVFKDSWKIEIAQLRVLLDLFPTAAYLFLHPEIVPFVVPAKLLLGLARARLLVTGRGIQKSVTVHYSQLRSAAIPLDQFVVDLVIGTWLGRMDEASLRVAKGDDPHVRPRVTVELSVRSKSKDRRRVQ